MTVRRLDKLTPGNPPADLTVFRHQRARSAARHSIVHLGVGAFHRAHQALYTDTVLDLDDAAWSITGASLRSCLVKEQLAAQDYLYTVVERENEGERYRLVGAVEQVIVAPEDPRVLIEAMACATCKIITLTITEKGYCCNPASGRLDLQDADIQHDLLHPQTPRSAPGFIAAALFERYRRGRAGLAVMSCDNLPANGQLTRQVILDFAAAVYPELKPWIDTHVQFPATMVDRIVPATTDEDRQQLERALGYRDEAMVVCEPFSQWVIEDCFVQPRPAWEKAGAIFVEQVHEFETMKLRLLNGSHSTLAYLGFLAGYQTVHEVMGDRHFLALVTHLMDSELTPTLVAPAQIDLGNYKAQLRQRFSNSALQHQTHQIAMDGSKKLPQRLIQPLLQQLRVKGAIDALCLAVAGWIRYTMGIDESGQDYVVSDPLARRMHLLHQRSGTSSRDILDNFLTLGEVFPQQLCREELFVQKTSYYLNSLLQIGALRTVQAFAAQLGAESASPDKGKMQTFEARESTENL